MGDWGNFGKRKVKFGKWPYYAPNPLSLAPSDLPPPIGPLTTAHDLCRYPSGLEGLGACAPAQSRYSFHDGLNLRYRGGIRRVWLAEFGVPIKADGGIVPGAADFVGSFAVIGFGWEIDEEDFVRGDGFEAVEDSWGDMNENSVVFADDDAVGFTVGGAFRAGVVECDFGHAVDDGHAVGLLFVSVPSFDDAWVDGAEVGLAEADEVGVVFAEDFHDAPAIVAVLGEG